MLIKPCLFYFFRSTRIMYTQRAASFTLLRKFCLRWDRSTQTQWKWLCSTPPPNVTWESEYLTQIQPHTCTRHKYKENKVKASKYEWKQ